MYAQLPDDGACLTQGQRAAQAGDVLAGQILEAGIHGGIADLVVAYFIEQIQGVAAGGRDDRGTGGFFRPLSQSLCLARSCQHMYRLVRQLCQVGERQRGVVLDQQITDARNTWLSASTAARAAWTNIMPVGALTTGGGVTTQTITRADYDARRAAGTLDPNVLYMVTAS